MASITKTIDIAGKPQEVVVTSSGISVLFDEDPEREHEIASFFVPNIGAPDGRVRYEGDPDLPAQVHLSWRIRWRTDVPLADLPIG